MSHLSSRTLISSRTLSRLALVALAVLGSAPVASAAPSPAAPPPLEGDRLTVTVRDARGAVDGTYEVTCRPSGGSHRDPAGACRALEQNTRWGTDPFAPVPDGSVCTMQYGGPATAHVTGVWAGRPVDARFDRSNGCEIERWDRFVPLLPAAGG
ncbi:SSI family serine proteinase inhibitor [Streptomyces sp. SAI-170]|uniref:SSI family serine proteinase inhibitor n=1 Tax=Streptomyces sp. SAI-170 TaxID=3377729 RepID=UPI003C7BB176